MTRSIPPVLTRAAFVDIRTGILTREGALMLDALRSAMGGDAATVTPVSPLGSLDPVSVAVTPLDGLPPVSGVFAHQDTLSPVCGCDVASGLDPVPPIGPETLP